MDLEKGVNLLNRAFIGVLLSSSSHLPLWFLLFLWKWKWSLKWVSFKGGMTLMWISESGTGEQKSYFNVNKEKVRIQGVTGNRNCCAMKNKGWTRHSFQPPKPRLTKNIIGEEKRETHFLRMNLRSELFLVSGKYWHICGNQTLETRRRNCLLMDM